MSENPCPFLTDVRCLNTVTTLETAMELQEATTLSSSRQIACHKLTEAKLTAAGATAAHTDDEFVYNSNVQHCLDATEVELL